ncbi:MAG: hypothetical protein LAP21_20140 [Acidobacteriia bacterium]|nr:hypothetical protein [Terriglobia bacterium]
MAALAKTPLHRKHLPIDVGFLPGAFFSTAGDSTLSSLVNLKDFWRLKEALLGHEILIIHRPASGLVGGILDAGSSLGKEGRLIYL